jgi:hypothetical protein
VNSLTRFFWFLLLFSFLLVFCMYYRKDYFNLQWNKIKNTEVILRYSEKSTLTVDIDLRDMLRLAVYRAYTKEWCGFNSVHY